MGDITINITNGTAPYHVELIPDIGTTWDFGTSGINVLSPVPAGEYTVKVTDDNGCVFTVGGVIINTPVEECDVFFVTGNYTDGIDDFKLYSYNPLTKTITYRYSYGFYSSDVACTDTRLWLPNEEYSLIKEYIINLDPFSISFNRELVVPDGGYAPGYSAFYYSNGLDVIEADDVLNVYKLVGHELAKYRLNHVTWDNSVLGTVDFEIVNTGRILNGDIKYNPDENVYTVTVRDYYDPNLREIIIYEVGYRNKRWVLDVTGQIINHWGLFVYGGDLYVTDENVSGTDIYRVTQDGLELFDTIIGIHVQGCAQKNSCGSFFPFTTTTTEEPTTTTTTLL